MQSLAAVPRLPGRPGAAWPARPAGLLLLLTGACQAPGGASGGGSERLWAYYLRSAALPPLKKKVLAIFFHVHSPCGRVAQTRRVGPSCKDGRRGLANGF